MKLIEPTDDNKNIIFNLMQKTLEKRKIMREESKTATQIIDNFPHLINFNGDIVSLIFKLHIKNCNFMKKFVFIFRLSLNLV